MSKRASGVCAAAAAALLVTLSNAAAGNAPVGAAAGAADDIRDIRGPKPLFPLALALELLAAFVVLAVLGYLLWRWRRRRQQRALKYFEIALQRLEQLRTLMQPENVREFSAAISDIVRSYIEAGFDVTATHQTTEEFLRGILAARNSPLSRHRSPLAEFLRQCDLAKFAGVSLSVDNMESLFESARTFIVATSPSA